MSMEGAQARESFELCGRELGVSVGNLGDEDGP